MESLYLCQSHMDTLAPYLPTATSTESNVRASLPQITLTYAASLDSFISLAPGKNTLLSGPESKSMTHYLRAHHDAILVGATTAIVDNPRLNSRWIGACGKLERQPRPVILDPSWVIVDTSVAINSQALEYLRLCGGECLYVPGYQGRSNGMDWTAVLSRQRGCCYFTRKTNECWSMQIEKYKMATIG